MDDPLEDLEDLAGEIDEARQALDDLYEQRADGILEALDAGYSLRDCGEALGISHTAVAKAIDGL